MTYCKSFSGVRIPVFTFSQVPHDTSCRIDVNETVFYSKFKDRFYDFTHVVTIRNTQSFFTDFLNIEPFDIAFPYCGNKSLPEFRPYMLVISICEELENGSIECIAIRRRCYMFYNLLARLDAYLTPLTYAMEDIIKTEGTDYSQFEEQSKKTIASAAATVTSIKAVLDTPILTDSGVLTEESESLLNRLEE